DPGGKSLVGHVEQGNQTPVADDLLHASPVLVGQVVAGRVVAAGVQHDHSAGFGLAERGDHGVDVDPVSGGVVVRVLGDFEAGPAEQGVVVLPARVGDQQLAVGRDGAEEGASDL